MIEKSFISVSEVTHETPTDELLATAKAHIKKRIVEKAEEHLIGRRETDEALRAADQILLFNSPLTLIDHIYAQNQLSSAKKANDALTVALAMMSTAAFMTKVQDGDKKKPLLAFMPMSTFLNKSDIMSHELEHIADSLLGLMHYEDVKTAQKFSTLALYFQGVLFTTLFFEPFKQALEVSHMYDSSEKSLIWYGLLAIGVLGTEIAINAYKATPHEVNANDATKKNQNERNALGKKPTLFEKIVGKLFGL